MTNKQLVKNRPTVSVVVLNWNGKKVISECLDSIYNQSVKPNEIIVVENNSSDGSYELVREKYPKVILLSQDKNLGFAGGVNVGILHSSSKYVWLLNNDARADKDCLKNLLITANKTDADIISSVILSDDGKTIDYDGDVYSTYGLPFPRHRGETVELIADNDEEIFSASGGASLYRRKLFEQIGYFDEMFFAYYEDVDISMRAQLVGKNIWLSRGAIVYHKMNYSADKIPGFGREMAIKNSIYLFWKNIPFPLIIKIFPRILYSNWRLTFSAIKNGFIIPALRAQLVALLHTPHLLVRRIKIQHSRKISSKDFEILLTSDSPFRSKGRS